MSLPAIDTVLSLRSVFEGAGLAALWPVLLLAVRATLLLVVAWATARLARGSAARHLVWTVALGALLLLPLGGFLPAVELAVLSPAPATSPELGTALAESGEASPISPAPESAGLPDEVGAGLSPRDLQMASVSTAERDEPFALRDPAVLATAIWLLGVMVLAGRLIASLLARRRLLAGAAELGGEVARRTRELASGLGVERPIRLLESADVQVPMTWGASRPVVLLPRRARDWGPDLLDSVLLHELAHVGRRDEATGLLAAVVGALYWPHPGVWGACRALRRESELAADDAVVRSSGSAVRYAEHLLRVVESLRRPVPRTVVAMGTGPRLTRRIGAILDETRDRTGPGWAGRLLLGAVVLLALVVTAAPVTLAAVSTEETIAFTTLVTESEVSAGDSRATVASHEGAWFEGCGDGSTSTSIHGEDDRQRIRVTRGQCEIRIDSVGSIEFSADERRIERLSPEARLTLEELRPGVRRRLAVEAEADGSPAITWWIDGREEPFDRRAEEWLAEMIPQIYRLTGWQAEERVARLLASGGVEAVLAEVPLIVSDHVQAIYLDELLVQGDLEGRALGRWLDLAGREVGSDHDLGRVLSKIPVEQLADVAVQRAFVEATRTIGSDHDLRTTLEHLLRQDGLSAELLEPLLTVAGSIGSDYELTELIMAITTRFPADRRLPDAFYDVVATIDSDYEMRRALARLSGRTMTTADLGRALLLSKRIGSDFELTELILDLMSRWPADEPLPPELFEAVATIGSDHDMSRAIGAIVDRPLSAGELARALELSRDIGSDYELAELLVGILRRHGDPVEARQAFEAALDGIGSESERGRVLDAWRHLGG